MNKERLAANHRGVRSTRKCLYRREPVWDLPSAWKHMAGGAPITLAVPPDSQPMVSLAKLTVLGCSLSGLIPYVSSTLILQLGCKTKLKPSKAASPTLFCPTVGHCDILDMHFTLTPPLALACTARTTGTQILTPTAGVALFAGLDPRARNGNLPGTE